MSTNAIIQGSLSAVAQQSGQSIAESFLAADTVCLVDVSGSMDSVDSRGGQKRYLVACQELAQLQQTLPGKIAVIAFSNFPQFCPAGIPLYQGGGTDLSAALEFVKIADGTVNFVVISDGEPNDPKGCLRVAKSFKSRIDCIFIGPEDDVYGGSQFLRKLAAASGGQYAVAAKARELANTVQTMMLGTATTT